jgi:hypothetical protein
MVFITIVEICRWGLGGGRSFTPKMRRSFILCPKMRPIDESQALKQSGSGNVGKPTVLLRLDGFTHRHLKKDWGRAVSPILAR